MLPLRLDVTDRDVVFEAAATVRIDTVGGTSPGTGCDAGHVGKLAQLRYAAVYEFHEAGK